LILNKLAIDRGNTNYAANLSPLSDDSFNGPFEMWLILPKKKWGSGRMLHAARLSLDGVKIEKKNFFSRLLRVRPGGSQSGAQLKPSKAPEKAS
jgi:hypothetical protein